MNLFLFAEKEVCSGDGRPGCSEQNQTSSRLLEALAGRGHTGTVILEAVILIICLKKKYSLLFFGVGDTDSIRYWIRNSCGTNL